MPDPFAVKDCALIAISTGRHARNLRELAMHLADVPIGAVYHHFWGGRMQPSFDEPEFQNDFAGWARHGLHDHELAERLGILDPMNYSSLEALRAEMLDLIDERLANAQQLQWVMAEQPFSFNRSQIVIYDTNTRIAEPKDFRTAAPSFSVGSVFYHFIDARRREPIAVDDFRAWLSPYGSEYDLLRARLEEIDPYFRSLAELKARLVKIFDECLPE
jgi:hypothetical protein